MKTVSSVRNLPPIALLNIVRHWRASKITILPKMQFAIHSSKPTNSVAEKNVNAAWKQIRNVLSFRKAMFWCFLLWLSLLGRCFSFPNHYYHVKLRSTPTSHRMTTEKNSLLVTFDLDNTLFPVAPVVRDADIALVRGLHDLGCHQATSDRIQGHINHISRKKRKRLTYSELRLRAIHQELLLNSDNSNNDDDDAWSKAHDVFDIWLQERHASAERHLFSDVVEALQSLPSEATVGAITNACGDPLAMNETLAPYFDFCVSGEDPHVFPFRKPHKMIFRTALQKYQQPGTIWCHVGDCLANDVGGSGNLGAKPIWVQLEENRHEVRPPSKSRRKLAKAAHLKYVRDQRSKMTHWSQFPSLLEEIVAKAM
mmetsp:Transcript_20020/g.29678  ORF Transcript_20020/g.29678 Transcript_20020/m.29678 type:complete len:369 (+) Transcript_20020:296-1402(+)